ncbi:MAG: 3-methyl-2-oxobutanoate dehydrogenase subunit beta [Nitrososphaeria archaeon]|nr:3-methyl-2-oxobutanoate dehydrogenase subunit beta [Nitrososphaeria archaeon]NIN53429.1 3-methyl-2-oxobutanoate dehydrogenase subunit beta [Nitrososphaeria archaeon]NIQ33944.1 3-methyl-2-oxobutanoate dehydrogenase subunit beta [Nitrososphaeria archaeon]
MSILKLPEEEYILPGSSACLGCGLALALRYALKALGERTILVLTAGCATSIAGLFPKRSYNIPSMDIAYAATAAAASGIAASLKVKGIEDMAVVGWAGDGGTYDIGIQALSGAAERGSDMIFICYDNEAYMNTGVQRSSSTPLGAYTTTTPVLGKRQHKKPMPLIMAMHGIPYVATACTSYPHDLYAKVKRARDLREGLRYVQIFSPCPAGWGYPSEKTVEMGRMAVETGFWPLYEFEDGKLRLTGVSKKHLRPHDRKPLGKYLRIQDRFKKLTPGDVEILQRSVDEQWELLERLM